MCRRGNAALPREGIAARRIAAHRRARRGPRAREDHQGHRNQKEQDCWTYCEILIKVSCYAMLTYLRQLQCLTKLLEKCIAQRSVRARSELRVGGEDRQC